jgi:hypothetical protein
MNYSSARGSSVHATVNLIMETKPLDTIAGQPTTKSMDWMTEQMAQMVAPVKTTAWGGLHGSCALVLNDVDYTTVKRRTVTLTARLIQPPAVNPAIKDNTPQCKLLRLQADTKNLQKAFDLQEALTNIGVQCIIDSVEEQYVKELNEDYFGYANQTIKSLLKHLHTNWYKVMTKECTDATEAFYHTWVPSSTHVITFGCQLTKLQMKCRTINIIVSDEAKTLHFIGPCIKVTTSLKIRLSSLRCNWMQARSGIPHLTTSPDSLRNARHTATNTLPIADSRVLPPCSMSPPTTTL